MLYKLIENKYFSISTIIKLVSVSYFFGFTINILYDRILNLSIISLSIIIFIIISILYFFLRLLLENIAKKFLLKSFKDKNFLIINRMNDIPIVLFYFGIIIAFVSILVFYSQYSFIQNSSKTTGEVVDTVVDNQREIGESDVYTLKIKYFENNKEKYFSPALKISHISYPVGDDVEILVSNTSDKVQINSFIYIWGLPILLLIFGIVFMFPYFLIKKIL